MSQTVVGIFNRAEEAYNAFRQLINNGFNESNVDYARGSESIDYADDEVRKDNESGISRFFRNLFGSNDESDRYSRAAKRGSIVTVHTHSDEEARRASELLDEYGAIDVDEDDRSYRENFGNTNDEYVDDFQKENKKIPVVEEHLEVGKRVVETGGVRVRSRIIEKPVEETIRLREEHVNVERNKVNRPVREDDFEEETIEMREHAEVPVVNKDAKVIEEVEIGKTVDHREETIRDNVRKKDVEIENLKSKDKQDNF